MSLIVRKAFNTAVRRFAVDDSLPADADLAPHTLTDLKQRHFVGEAASKAPAKAVKPRST